MNTILSFSKDDSQRLGISLLFALDWGWRNVRSVSAASQRDAERARQNLTDFTGFTCKFAISQVHCPHLDGIGFAYQVRSYRWAGPKIESKSLFCTCFHFFVELDFDSDFHDIFAPFWSPKLSRKVLKIQKKMIANRSLDFDSLLARFWLDLERSEPRSDHAGAVETHVGHFWRRLENSWKLTPKWLPKSSKNQRIWANKWCWFLHRFFDDC